MRPPRVHRSSARVRECGPKVRNRKGMQSFTFDTSEVTTISAVSRSESAPIGRPMCQGRLPE